MGAWRFGPAGEASAGERLGGAEPTVQSTPTPERVVIPIPTPPPTPPEWRLLAGGDVLMELTEAAGIAWTCRPCAVAGLASAFVACVVGS